MSVECKEIKKPSRAETNENVTNTMSLLQKGFQRWPVIKDSVTTKINFSLTVV